MGESKQPLIKSQQLETKIISEEEGSRKRKIAKRENEGEEGGEKGCYVVMWLGCYTEAGFG